MLATLYVVTRQLPPHDLAAALHAGLAAQDAVLGGVSELPNGCGVAVRLLGRTSLEVKNAVHLAWNTARLKLIGVPAPDVRKG